MLVSVAAYPLWLHWRPVGEWLATQFLDYEPGIHWSQMQMQSGTTGINTTRVYNPLKQAQDHDPYGKFINRWLPANRHVAPLLDLAVDTREAKSRLHARRQDPLVRDGKNEVIEKHASRKVFSKTRAANIKQPVQSNQMGFDF
jgi:deoxyribodipyrimidine photo-lyase